MLLWIAIGGALGSVLRYLVGAWIEGAAGQAFPWGTMTVNVAGCLLIGFAMRAFPALHVSQEMRAFVTVGLAGGFTTFSTFGWETFVLMETGHAPRAFVYLFVSVGLGLAAVLAGWTLAVRVTPAL